MTIILLLLFLNGMKRETCSGLIWPIDHDDNHDNRQSVFGYRWFFTLSFTLNLILGNKNEKVLE